MYWCSSGNIVYYIGCVGGFMMLVHWSVYVSIIHVLVGWVWIFDDIWCVVICIFWVIGVFDGVMALVLVMSMGEVLWICDVVGFGVDDL